MHSIYHRPQQVRVPSRRTTFILGFSTFFTTSLSAVYALRRNYFWLEPGGCSPKCEPATLHQVRSIVSVPQLQTAPSFSPSLTLPLPLSHSHSHLILDIVNPTLRPLSSRRHWSSYASLRHLLQSAGKHRHPFILTFLSFPRFISAVLVQSRIGLSSITTSHGLHPPLKSINTGSPAHCYPSNRHLPLHYMVPEALSHHHTRILSGFMHL